MSENLSRVENDLSELVDGTGEVTVPMSRVEVILHKLLGEEYPNIVPQSRVEELLLELYDKEITGDIIPKEITEPGIYNASSEGKDGYNPVNVNIVIPPAPVLTTKNVTDNGTYAASSDNADGYSEVTVDVAPPENSFILNTKKDDVVDISDAADFDIAGLKVDVTASDEVLVGVGNGTEFIENNTPYLFREMPHDVGDRVYEDAIVGASMAWNQLYPKHTSYGGGTDLGVTISIDSDGYVNVTGTATADGSFDVRSYLVNGLANHAYLILCDGYNGFRWARAGFPSVINYGLINKYNTDFYVAVRVFIDNGVTYNIHARFCCFDLTLALGQAIADYAYTLESSEAGSGIAWLKSQGFFTKDYYAYNAGGIQSVKTSAKKVVGFNQLKTQPTNVTGTRPSTIDVNDTIASRVFGGTIYNIHFVLASSGRPVFKCYDLEGNEMLEANIINATTYSSFYYNPTNKYEITAADVTGTKDYLIQFKKDCFVIMYYYNSAITNACLNLHWDGERDGEYEAYKEHTYPLGNDELRGIYKLSNGKIYADGDVKTSDGQINRRYAIVDLGTLDYEANTSGTKKYFWATFTEAKSYGSPEVAKMVCSKYVNVAGSVLSNYDKVISRYYGYRDGIVILDSAYAESTEEQFKSAMSGVYLVYEKATPTTETADPYTNPQLVDNWGTEEFVDERDVPVPVGHESKYFDGEIYHTYIYDSNNERIEVTGTADLLTGEVTGGNHCGTFVIKPTGDNVVVENGEVEVKYLSALS